jgi:hypothetical protein
MLIITAYKCEDNIRYDHEKMNETLYSICINRYFVVNIVHLNPKPHGSGRICPHYFQRPITQKGLKQKNRQKSAIPRKMSAE